jgi:hypothetical protein
MAGVVVRNTHPSKLNSYSHTLLLIMWAEPGLLEPQGPKGMREPQDCAGSVEKYQFSLEAGLETLRQEAGRRREEGGGRREEGLLCGGQECTGCLFRGQGCSTQPARRGRKGRKEGGQREHVPAAWGGGAGEGGEL